MTSSKSKYTTGVRCPKLLWLEEYSSSVLSPADSHIETKKEIGHEVGELACKLFSPGEKIPYSSCNNYKSMLDRTQKLIESDIPHIYEATFVYDGIVVIVDILRKTENGFEIYEVKSSTDSKNIKDTYFHDVAIQQYVLSQLGYKVRNSHLVHLNHQYVRGGQLDIEALFTIDNISEVVNEYCLDVPTYLKSQQVFLDDGEHEPNIDIGKHCNNPYECSAKEYCWKVQRNIPNYSMFNIFNLGSKKQIDLYSRGIVNIQDIPDDYKMTPLQEERVLNYKHDVTYVDKESIQIFLDTLSYPIYHLDFETFQQAVPKWEGLSPYQQIPFQYSLHIHHEDGTVEHREFLAEDGKDPREELAIKLIQDIPTNVTVLTYNMSFEKGVIKKLAERFENLSSHLLAINDNIYDLMIPFKKLHYVTPSMEGSHSIKYILPALVPHMSNAYQDLPLVHNGSDAMNAFATLGNLSPSEKELMRAGLKEYCKLDTLSMVEIIKHLKGLH